MIIDALILAGGKGTRLARVVSDRPKPLAEVGGRPFLDWLLAQLSASGQVGRVVLSLGHLAQVVIDHYGRETAALPLDFVVEPEPLGTGGGLLHAAVCTTGDPVLVLNGDSILALDIPALLEHHRATGTLVTLALVPVEDTARYGKVTLDGSRVTGFVEKVAAGGPGLINGGVYVFSRAALERFPQGRASLETDLLPPLVAEGRVSGFVSTGAFIDIGLPETYAVAMAAVADVFGLSLDIVSNSPLITNTHTLKV